MGRPLNSDGRDTRQALLDAGLDVFAEKGFHGSSLKEIAAVVGVRDSAIYHYFDSKEALFDAIVAERPDRATDAERKALLATPVTDVRASLESIATGIIERLESPRVQKLYRLLMADGLRLHTEKRINLLQAFDNQVLVKFMGRLIEEKKLRAASPDLLVMEFIAPFHTLTMLRLFSPRHPLVQDPPAFVRAHVEQFLVGASRKRP